MIHNLSLKIYVFVLIIISLFLLLNFNKGLDLTDESFHLLRSLYPLDEIGRLSNFGFLNSIILEIVNYKISILRIYGFVILFFSNLYLVIGFFNFIEKKKSKFDNFYLIFIFSFAGTFSYYFFWLPTPSYNFYNLVGILIFFGGLFRIWDSDDIKYYIKVSIIIILGGFISFLSKVPSVLILFCLFSFFLIFLSKLKFFNKIKLLFFLTSFSLTLIYLFINMGYESYNNFFEDLLLGKNIYALRDINYSITKQLIFPVKQILHFIIVKNYIPIFLTLFLFFFLRNNYKKDYYFILYIIFLFLVLRQPLIIIFLISIYLIYFKHNKIKKSNVYVFFILILGAYAYSFGTNTNFVRHLNYVNILFFLVIFYSLNFLTLEKKKLVNIFLLFLTIYSSVTVYIAFDKPYRLLSNVLNQNNKIELPFFQGFLKVDQKTHKYIVELQKLSKENKWKLGDYLIDLTGRNPGANIVLGAKYIGKPWYLSGYSGSDLFVSELLRQSSYEKIKRSWILTTDGTPSISHTVLEVQNLNLEVDYILVGKIQALTSKNDIFYHYLWKPKYSLK